MPSRLYSRYSGSLESIFDEFVRYLKYTFGDIVQYVGTTTGIDTPLDRIRDIDIMVVFSSLSENYISYSWSIINRLHAKYNILLDTRIYSTQQLANLPSVNKYLLKMFLNDLLGENPFKDYSLSRANLVKQCIQRIDEQKEKIIAIMPRIAGDSTQIKYVAQCVYDAMRAFLIIERHPTASKEQARKYFSEFYQEFNEVDAIYEGYLEPDSIIDVTNYLLDSLAVIKHLYYKALNKPISRNVLLINTPSSNIAHPKYEYLSYDHNMPLGLVCLASFLADNNCSVEILDAYAENLGSLSTVDRIMDEKSLPKIIGLNSSSPNIHIVHKIASYLKRINSKLVIVCGGPHASLATEHTLSTGQLDFAVVGEGEIPFLNLVRAILGNKKEIIKNIPGIYSCISGNIEGHDNKEFLDLAKLPLPDFNYLPLQRYFSVKKRIYIHLTRGCAFNCIYCSVPKFWGGTVREIPIELILSQFSKLVESYHPDEIQIVDDNFSHRRGALIKKFCHGKIALALPVKWKCQARADQLDANTIKLMADAGCFEIDLGIESGNKEIQRYIRKGLNLEKTKEMVHQIHENGIYAKAFFMLGFPEESFAQIGDTINYAIELKQRGLDDVAFFPVMPFPGTEISEVTGKVVFQGALIDTIDVYEHSFAAHRLRKYSAKPELSLNSAFTPETLRQLVKFAYQRFNLNLLITDLTNEFGTFVSDEEGNMYGI